MSCAGSGSLSFKRDVRLSWMLHRRRALRSRKLAHRLFITAGVLFVVTAVLFIVVLLDSSSPLSWLATRLFYALCPGAISIVIGLFYLTDSLALSRIAAYQENIYRAA